MPERSEPTGIIVPSIRYQWQNLHLRKSIYPFRKKKLRDFLVIYHEIDLWKQFGSWPVHHQTAAELIREHTNIRKKLAIADFDLQQTKKITGVEADHREVLYRDDVKKLRRRMNNLKRKLVQLESRKKTRERQVSWYSDHAPEYPYYEKWNADLEEILISYNQVRAELEAVENEYHLILAPFEGDMEYYRKREINIRREIKILITRVKEIPGLKENTEVSQSAAVRWLVYKYKQDLSRLDHDQLLIKIIDRFDREPDRFPKWLQYMVIHFSGMRYCSAHGSWSKARDLVRLIRLDELQKWLLKGPVAEFEPEKLKLIEGLEKERKGSVSVNQQWRLDHQLQALRSSNWRKEMLRMLTPKKNDEVTQLSDAQVLDELRAMKGIFPAWAWKEVVSRTELRLEVKRPDWETLSKSEQNQRWQIKDNHWWKLVNEWKRMNITGWRDEHARTLELIVTRAVCNEIAEHIQHLRGVDPAPGLTYKAKWYSNLQRESPTAGYFKKPRDSSDFLSGSSIFFLGWSARKPNTWQVANPIGGLDLLPGKQRKKKVKKKRLRRLKTGEWQYETDPVFKRSTRTVRQKKIQKPGGKGVRYKSVPGEIITEWLRWIHEATVVEVAGMAAGRYVLTFETGQIGLNIRPLRRLINHWDIYVGYVPKGEVDTRTLDRMLVRSAILPKETDLPVAYDSILAGEVSEAPIRVLAMTEADHENMCSIVSQWESLTLRQKQVISMVVNGKSTQEIAENFYVKTSTVRSHISNAMEKFYIETRDDF